MCPPVSLIQFNCSTQIYCYYYPRVWPTLRSELNTSFLWIVDPVQLHIETKPLDRRDLTTTCGKVYLGWFERASELVIRFYYLYDPFNTIMKRSELMNLLLGYCSFLQLLKPPQPNQPRKTAIMMKLPKL